MTRKHTLLFAAVIGAALAAATAPAFAQEAGRQKENDPLNAVVKLDVSSATRSCILPWVAIQDSCSGSGVVIAPGRILTCAHCVADATYIRVRKNNEDAIFHAETEFIDHDRDLSLLRVEDPVFMAGIVPMELGETPKEQSEVIAVGFPIGGDLISYTRGIVSRIEDIEYAHGRQRMLAVQVDAAINPGNSGGPVLDMDTLRVVGIAFQGRKDGESLGYLIPAEIVRCFLDDMADGRLDGVHESLFVIEELESEAKRRFLGMAPGQTGVEVTYVSPALCEDSLHIGDILMEIDGHRVANNGVIRVEGNQIRSLKHPFNMRQIGDHVPVKVLRDGKVIPLSVLVEKMNTYSRRFLYEKAPDWFVWGGFVFTTFSYSYAGQVSKCRIFDDVFSEDKEHPDDRFVMVSQVFSDVSVEGYLGLDGTHVRSIDGVKVRNLPHLVELLEGSTNKFVQLGMDIGNKWDSHVVVDAAQMREVTPRVMRRFKIPVDRSEDLLATAKP